MNKYLKFLKSKEEFPKKEIITKNVVVIVFEMDICHVMKWNDPLELYKKYKDCLNESSCGVIQYNIKRILGKNEFPVIKNWNFVDSYNYRAQLEKNSIPETECDYRQTIEKFHGGINEDVDEYWWFGGPWFGFNESQMIGKNAIWCNSPSLYYNDRNKIIMGFNYERGIGEMLESFCHRVESIMSFCEPTAWSQFILDCGSVHCPPNTYIDYNWGNKNLVETNCDAWYEYPDYKDKRKVTNCVEWGNGDITEHHMWWLKHIPVEWYKYICDMSILDEYKSWMWARNILNRKYYLQKFKI